MKQKLLPTAFVILVVLNIVLLVLFITKPEKPGKIRPKNNFLVEQLEFNKDQKDKFYKLDQTHRQKMRSIDEQIRTQKDLLFRLIEDEGANIDSITTLIGNLEKQKDLELYSFFKSIRSFCTPEQIDRLNSILKDAVRVGPGPPHGKGGPPPRH